MQKRLLLKSKSYSESLLQLAAFSTALGQFLRVPIGTPEEEQLGSIVANLAIPDRSLIVQLLLTISNHHRWWTVCRADTKVRLILYDPETEVIVKWQA